MKKLFLILSLILISIVTNAQNRLQSISTALSQIGRSPQQMAVYLKNKGFVYSNRSGNILTYVKQTNYGEHTLHIAYRNSKLSNIAWNEHFVYYRDVIGEIEELGFESPEDNPYMPTRSFTHPKSGKRITIIMRPSTNDEFINIGS